MSEFNDMEVPAGKVFNETQVVGGAFLGGPLVAGYLIAENFKTFGQQQKVVPTWIITILSTVALLAAALLIPEGGAVQRILPFLYTIIAYVIVKTLQRNHIRSHIVSGGKLQSWWHTLAAVVGGLVLTVIAIVTWTFISDPSVVEPADVKHYGNLQHEIAFKEQNISPEEVDKIANGLTATAFFNDEYRQFAFVEKMGRTIEISAALDEEVVHRQDVISDFEDVQQDMQMLFPGNKIVFNLTVGSYDNVFRKID